MALKYLRDNLKSLTWVLWIVVAVLALAVFLDFGGFGGGAGPIQDTDVAATVGDEKITYAQFRQEHDDLRARYQQLFGEQFNDQMATSLNLPLQALNSLISQRILLREAREMGLAATDDEVRQAILDTPELQDENGRFIGTEKYLELLRRNRRTAAQVEEQVRDNLLLYKLDAVLADTAYISDAELEQAYRDRTERAKVRYAVLPASELAGAVSSDPAEVESYFAEHRDDYRVPEQRVADYLLVDIVQMRRDIEVPEDELRAYYDANAEEFDREEQVRARHILLKVGGERSDEQARQELEAIRGRVAGGEDFAAIAREVSEDPSSASRGGSLGFFGRGQMVPAFEEAAFGAEIGELVGPVKSDFGYHLIEVQDHQPGGRQAFEDVSQQIRARLLRERVDELAETKAFDVAGRLAEDGADLETIAAEEGLEVTTTPAFGADDNITGLGRAIEFSRAAFELAEGEISEAVRVPRGWAILRLAEIIAPQVPDLEAVRPQVEQALARDKQKDLAVERMTALGERVAGGEDFAAVVGDLGLDVKESEELGRTSRIADLGGGGRRVIESALTLDEGAVGGPFATADGAVLFEVVERQKFDAEEFAEARESTRVSEENERLARIKRALVERRKLELEPTYSPQLQETFQIQPTGVG